MAESSPLIIAGNSHPELASNIADALGVDLVDAVIDHFPDGECQIKIHDNVRDEDVFVIQPTGPPVNENIIEAALMIDALGRASASRVTLFTPYLGYSRQDRKDEGRVPISVRGIINMFGAVGVDRLAAVDLHADQIQGMTDIPFDHLKARDTIAEAIAEEFYEKPVVVAPDVSASKKAFSLARVLGTNDVAIIDKKRIDARTTKATGIVGSDVRGREAIMIDDIASTAGSLITGAEFLRENGAVRAIAAVTHGVLVNGAPERLDANDSLERLYVTDTLPQPHITAKIGEISIVPLLAEAVDRIHNGKSVSALFGSEG